MSQITRKAGAEPPLRTQKRGDMIVEEIKRRLASKALRPGEMLPKEAELQAMFGVSKGTIREALKSLEVQGFVSVSTGPAGGARVLEVPFDRTFQLVQNYLFFRDVTVDDIYALRRLIEPELAAGAVPHLTISTIKALEASIEMCEPKPVDFDDALRQRHEDLHFHDILAESNPNTLLVFFCRMINRMLQKLIVFQGDPLNRHYAELGKTNTLAHREILAAVKDGDSERVRALMLAHIIEAETHVRKLRAAVSSEFVIDSNVQIQMTPRNATKRTKK